MNEAASGIAHILPLTSQL